MLLPVPVDFQIKAPQAEVRFVDTAKRIEKLGTGMTFNEIQEIVTFIETLNKGYLDPYLRKEHTKLARTIEIDPATNRYFIHLKSKNMPHVGKGYHKKVTYSILYDRMHPQLVSCAVVEDSNGTRKEIELLEKFRVLDCIITPMHISRHTKKSKDVRVEIITPLYNKGSLRTLIANNPKSVPISAKCVIARDILKAIATLNSLGYLSLDNNNGNFFIHEEGGIYKVAIGDVGGYTVEPSYAINKRPFGPSFRSSPPDLHKAYFEQTLTEDDLFSSQTFSIGRTLYFLLFENDPPWIHAFKKRYKLISSLYKDKSNPLVLQEIEDLTEEIQSHTLKRLDVLEKKERTKAEDFEYFVLCMLSMDPDTRKTVPYWRDAFTSLCSK